MAKLPTITTITSANNTVSTLNSNFSALRSAFENFLSRDGETPNTMTADLDMNSQDILNAKALKGDTLHLAGVLVQSVGNLANWAGTWTTATAYDPYDIVYVTANNIIYRCLTGHTSGTFSTDLGNGLWEVYIGAGLINQADANITGGTIAGLTSLEAADPVFTGTFDVSGIGNAGDVLTDLGAQAQDDLLDDIAAVTLGTGEILRYDGANLAASPGDQAFVIACSDETTDLTTGTAKVTFRMPYAFTVTGVRASVTTAPTGSTIEVDINEGGASILSTVLSIDASETSSETAATPAVISDSALADDAEITIDIDQVGSTVAGAGLKVAIIGYPT